MKKLLLPALLSLSLTGYAQVPDTLLYERFETGGATFALNTSDIGGASGSAGYNQWIINNAYNGGNGQLVCLGFPFNFTIPNTPLQPAGQTGNSGSNYLHIMSDIGVAQGIQNNSFQAADGICGLDETNFTAMTQDVVTTAYDSVTVSFLWLCLGGTNIYGEFYYSTNSGSTWNIVATPVSQYRNQPTWVQQSITLPAFAGQGAVRFGFRFVNSNSASAAEPGFGIDEFLITGKNAAPAPVAAFGVSDTALCQSGCVDYTDLSTGTPTSWLWIFQGAATAFSTQQNPSQICYNSPGTYEVTLIVSGATGTDTLTLSTLVVHPDPVQPVITFTADTLFATPGFASYEWSLNGTVIAGAGDDYYVVLTDGAYSVTVTDTNGCTAASIPLNYATGLVEQGNEVLLQIYPNPSAGIFHLGNGSDFRSITIVNALGATVREWTNDQQLPGHFDLSNEPEGVYFINALHKNDKRVYRKLLLL